MEVAPLSPLFFKSEVRAWLSKQLTVACVTALPSLRENEYI